MHFLNQQIFQASEWQEQQDVQVKMPQVVADKLIFSVF